MYYFSDEAQAKMLALKEKSDKEMVQYNMELKNIRRTLEHDRKLKEFMTVKAQEREMDEESLARKRKKDAAEKAEKAEEAITVRMFPTYLLRIEIIDSYISFFQPCTQFIPNLSINKQTSSNKQFIIRRTSKRSRRSGRSHLYKILISSSKDLLKVSRFLLEALP